MAGSAARLAEQRVLRYPMRGVLRGWQARSSSRRHACLFPLYRPARCWPQGAGRCRALTFAAWHGASRKQLVPILTPVCAAKCGFGMRKPAEAQGWAELRWLHARVIGVASLTAESWPRTHLSWWWVTRPASRGIDVRRQPRRLSATAPPPMRREQPQPGVAPWLVGRVGRQQLDSEQLRASGGC